MNAHAVVVVLVAVVVVAAVVVGSRLAAVDVVVLDNIGSSNLIGHRHCSDRCLRTDGVGHRERGSLKNKKEYINIKAFFIVTRNS